MKALSGLDGAFLHLETEATPMHVASLHLFELPPGYGGDFFEQLKRQMRARLKQAPVFTRQLAPMPLGFANPVWVEADKVDLDYHMQRISLPPPGTQAQLEDCAGRLHAELLDRRYPLWRLYVIDGLQSGQAAYYIKVHHAVVDGQAGVMLAKALFDITPKPPRVGRQDSGHGEHPGMAALAAAALKHDVGQYIKLVRHLPDVVRTLAGMFGVGLGKAPGGLGQSLVSNLMFGPKTPLNVPITAERGFAATTVPMDTLKALAHAHEAKVNDVVMALVSGALRRWLARHGGVPRKPLIASMPISLRAPGNTEYTTQATMVLVNLHTHVADPVKRLRAIRDAAQAMKTLAAQAKGVLPTDFPSIGMPWLMHGLAELYGRVGAARAVPAFSNVVISNVPGPQVPLYAAGARMLSYFPMSIVEHGVGLNVTVLSYAGSMCFGFTTAQCAVPDARELSAAVQEALQELQARTLKVAAKKKAPAAAGRGPATKKAAPARKATRQPARKVANKPTPRARALRVA